MTPREKQLRGAFAALDNGDFDAVTALFTPDAQWHGLEGAGFEGETPTWHNRREVVDLLESHHRHGMRFALQEVVEQDDRIAVGFAPGFYKVFTFEGAHAVHLQDCVDRDDALRRLVA